MSKYKDIFFYCGTALLVSLFIVAKLLPFILCYLFIYLFYDFAKIPLLKLKLSNTVAIYTITIFLVLLVALGGTFIVPLLKNSSSSIEAFKLLAHESILTINRAFNLNLDYVNLKNQALKFLISNSSSSIKSIIHVGKLVFLSAIAIFISHTYFISRPTVFTSDNTFTQFVKFLQKKCSEFYEGFKTFYAAQIIIAVINAALSFVWLYVFDFPSKAILTLFVLLFSLIPVFGNVISNTIIVGVAFVEFDIIVAGLSLIFLIFIHKLEYLVNSNLIGKFTSLPAYIIILALILGEGLFKIPGLIISVPFLLFIKRQLEQYP